MNDTSTQPLAEAFASIIEVMLASIRARGVRCLIHLPMIIFFTLRMRRLIKELTALLAAFRAGTLPLDTPRPTEQDRSAAHAQPAEMPASAPAARPATARRASRTRQPQPGRTPAPEPTLTPLGHISPRAWPTPAHAHPLAAVHVATPTQIPKKRFCRAGLSCVHFVTIPQRIPLLWIAHRKPE